MSESKKALLDLCFWGFIACIGAYALVCDIGRMEAARRQAKTADSCPNTPMPALSNPKDAAK